MKFFFISIICFFVKINESFGQKVEKDQVPSGYTLDSTKGIMSIDFEQDYFLDWIPNTNFDRNYSQGTAFSYTKYNLNNSFIFWPINFIEKLTDDFSRERQVLKLPATIGIGVTAFTPLDIADSLNPVLGDRPFANVAFLSTTKNQYNINTKILSSTTFSYGIIGSNIANAFQSYAHANIIKGRPTNIGWQYQISNGGHPAFLLTHIARRSFINKTNKRTNKNWLEGILGYKFNLGWYTGIAANATFKIGDFGKKNNLTLGISNSLEVAQKTIENVSSKIEKRNEIDEEAFNDAFKKQIEKSKDLKIMPKKYNDFYFFYNISPRLTPYNSLILGQPNIKSIYTLPNNNYNPFILDMEYGLFFSHGISVDDVPIPLKSYDLILSINSRTSEIVSKDVAIENPFSRTHYWGRVTLRFPLF